MLLTRSPLHMPRRALSLDLHVLSTPPAFVLSQDQTLQQCEERHPPDGGNEQTILSDRQKPTKLSIHQAPDLHPQHTPNGAHQKHKPGIGTDYRHAVEFSRNRRSPPTTLRPHAGQLSKANHLRCAGQPPRRGKRISTRITAQSPSARSCGPSGPSASSILVSGAPGARENSTSPTSRRQTTRGGAVVRQSEPARALAGRARWIGTAPSDGPARPSTGRRTRPATNGTHGGRSGHDRDAPAARTGHDRDAPAARTRPLPTPRRVSRTAAPPSGSA